MMNNHWWESPNWSKDEILRKTDWEIQCDIFPEIKDQYLYHGKYIDFIMFDGIQCAIVARKEELSVSENKKFIGFHLKENIDKLPYNFLRNILRIDPEMSELFELGG